ncbi:MAG: glycosyltransferase [Mesotoga sp.]|uniref:glycosyltransferase n=1 Tax=unclassified Mesotoga TaxID=1184398 RepID=UPI000EF2689E|nr:MULTISPECIES: glycosyltransferase [unclassified Mesotoga]MDI9366968.1 glycosyltransferase [Thermotogota bacterium]MDD2333336.1 glycosyltransferase [Mesotoga sp.]MDD3680556.1 glycosyltransferase [Mesotoga sp.]MDD4207170.1 glycosyltransferase [Mesotoga sp.]MDD4824917.1 glycosyltransferase [Mesotoga sp.]
MKVLLYSEGKKLFSKSGVGIALKHQMSALDKVGVKYTTNEEDSFDIVHINTIGPGAERVLKKSKKLGIPIIYHTHTTYEDFRNSFTLSNAIAPWLRKRLIKLYSSADFLISPTEYAKKLIMNYGITLPIKAVSNGVDNKKFTRSKSLAESFLSENHIRKPLVVSVGLPFERKGVIDFCQIADTRKDLTFYWFGAKISSLLPAKIRRLLKNPPDNVKFPGFIPQEMIIGPYSACDVFLFPSYEETEGIVVLEALATEAPIVLRDIPVYSEWMKHEENCLKGKDNQEFIKHIDRLLESNNLRKKLSSCGKETALERDLSIIGQKLKNIYLEVLDKKQ